MKKIYLSMISACLFWMVPQFVFAATSGVTVSISTDNNVYSISQLGTTPVVVSLFVENNSDQWLVLSEDPQQLNNTAQFANMDIQLACKSGQAAPCGSPFAVKGLSFRNTNMPAYQNVATVGPTNFYTNKTGPISEQLLGVTVGPHERKMVARAEFYASDFNTLRLVPGVYETEANIFSGGIWDWVNQINVASENGPGFNAITMIKFVK